MNDDSDTNQATAAHPQDDTTVPSQTNTSAAAICHLLSLVQFLGVPLGGIIGPLVLWLVKRNEDPLVDACGKEAVNFQISMLIYLIIAGILIFAVIGLILVPVLLILNIVYTVIAAIKASEGTVYHYPLTIRLIN